jgi:undecaprenyl-diphosphatase
LEQKLEVARCSAAIPARAVVRQQNGMPSERTSAAVAIARFTLVCCAIISLGWLSEEVMEGNTVRFDAYARAAVHADSSAALTSVMWAFTELGSVAVWGSLLTAAVVILWLQGWRRPAVMLAITMGGTSVLVETLKVSFHRSRPIPYFGIIAPHSFSYPSGHAMYSFSFYATLAALATAHLGAWWGRAIVWAIASGVIGLIGFSRIYLGVHYPTDVIAGYLTAFIWVTAVSAAERHCRGRWAQGRDLQ